MQASGSLGRKVTEAPLAPPGPPALQYPLQSTQSAATAPLFPESPGPEDHQALLDHKGPQESMESLVILVRMEKLVLKDPEASLELQVIPD